ncbi:MAG: relaxase domain-containing protein [Candidatus Competibacteraceae bacterium]|nr:relaxase domain-containing protein [Candidatus Competibacteraceae bacterium]
MSDPHLHGHCFTFNATFHAEEERWKAGQYREIKRDMPYYQRAFHSRLAANLEKLGFITISKDLAFEIEGVPDSVNEKFSQRTVRIEKEAHKRGITNPKMKANLGALTRAPKAHATAKDGLRETLARMSPDEHADIHKVLAAQQKRPARVIGASIEGKAIDYARSRAFERQSVVDEKEFLEIALRLGGAQVDPTKLRTRVAADPTLIHRMVDGRTVITTPEVLAEEEKLVAWVQKGHGVMAPLAQGHTIADTRLTDEQRTAVQHVLDSRDRVTGVQGKAGTGKTTLMKETIAAIEAVGNRSWSLPPPPKPPATCSARKVLPKPTPPNSFSLTNKCRPRQSVVSGGLTKRGFTPFPTWPNWRTWPSV